MSLSILYAHQRNPLQPTRARKYIPDPTRVATTRVCAHLFPRVHPVACLSLHARRVEPPDVTSRLVKDAELRVERHEARLLTPPVRSHTLFFAIILSVQCSDATMLTVWLTVCFLRACFSDSQLCKSRASRQWRRRRNVPNIAAPRRHILPWAVQFPCGFRVWYICGQPCSPAVQNHTFQPMIDHNSRQLAAGSQSSDFLERVDDYQRSKAEHRCS